MEGWRKSKDWFRSLQNLNRAVGQAGSSGGRGKVERVKKSTKRYLTKTTSFRNKLEKLKKVLPINDSDNII